RTRTSVPNALKIILALDRAIGESLRRRYALRQFSDRRRKIEENPMREHTGRRVGVFTNQRETLRVRRDVTPPQVRREIIAIAGVFCRDRFAFQDGVAGNQNVHCLLPFGSHRVAPFCDEGNQLPLQKPSYSSASLPGIQRCHPSSPFPENRYASEPIPSRGNFFARLLR